MAELFCYAIIGLNVASVLYSCYTVHRFYVRVRQQQARWLTLEREQMLRWQAAFQRLAQEEARRHRDDAPFSC